MIDQRDIFLKGEYVDLKVLTPQDIEESNWYGWFNDADLMSGIASQHMYPNSKEKQQLYLELINRSSEWLVLGIVPKSVQHIIGIVSLKNINMLARSASHAQVIGEKKYRTFAISYESNKLIFDHAFQGLGLNRISGGSIDSLQIEFMCRFYGFQKEGVLRKHEFKNGQYVDGYVMGLLKDEYLPAGIGEGL